jgi:hypothetical protein
MRSDPGWPEIYGLHQTQIPLQTRVSYEKPVRVINRESNERFEAGVPSVANEVNCLGLGVENENRAD